MNFITNIGTISKYESKLLLRSWFFKVFAILAIAISGVFCFFYFLSGGNYEWEMTANPSFLANFIALILNVGQAVVSVFLSAEYLKRDKQLDTSEVFYVRPLSNAEYLLGKMWGTLRVFFSLDFIILGSVMLISFIKLGTDSDYLNYFWYFLLLIFPTLIFIVGLSTFLMMLLKNQALTFVILLGYIGITIFYVGDVFYYLFDYMGFNIPMVKSLITGFANLPAIINHRIMYLMLGVGFVLLNITLFGRLANSHRSNYPWIVLAVLFFIFGIGAGYLHIDSYLSKNKLQARIIELNNKHVNDPKMVVDSCSMYIQQKEAAIDVKSTMRVRPLKQAATFTFCLNPGMEVTSVTSNGKELSYERLEHLLLVDFGKKLPMDENTDLVISYNGIVDERTCYLDIPEELLIENESYKVMNIGKSYSFQTPDYLLLTPETYWYPKPGVSYSNESPDWQQNYFTHYQLLVKPNTGLVAITQGQRIEKDSVTEFIPEQKLQSLSLCIGKYKELSVDVDSTHYAVWYIDGHDYFNCLDSIADTIPSMIHDLRLDYEIAMNMPYSFNRFALVEVPVHFRSYSRAWTQAQEVVQPEMIFLPEKGCFARGFNFPQNLRYQRQQNGGGSRRGGGGGFFGRGGGGTRTELDIQMDVFRGALRFMMDKNGKFSWTQGKLGQGSVSIQDNPYYFFPEMYNFRYNVYSSKWPVANRLIELFLQSSNNNQNWMHRDNGLSNDEKALLMMQERSFKELLTEVKHRDLMNNFIGLAASNLFVDAQRNMGIAAFKDSLFSKIKEQEFQNISFETLLDTMEVVSKSKIIDRLEAWDKPSQLAAYMIGTPEVTLVETKEEEVYQAEIVISNVSGISGDINFKLNVFSSSDATYGADGKPTQWIVHFEPYETKRIVSHWEEAPSNFEINTLMASNLPSLVRVQANGTMDGYTLTDEGEYDVSPDFLKNKDEIIVDNEDTTLFELSADAPSGLLQKWINESDEDDFKYKALREWRPPFQWTASTDERFYGLAIRSASSIRSGDGNQYATWHVPLDGSGTYDVYYYVRKPDEMRWNNDRGRGHGGGGDRRRGEVGYNFIIKHEDIEEETILDMYRADDGWNLLGTYTFETDTVDVVLNNKTELRMVAADAVKFVKRENKNNN